MTALDGLLGTLRVTDFSAYLATLEPLQISQGIHLGQGLQSMKDAWEGWHQLSQTFADLIRMHHELTNLVLRAWVGPAANSLAQAVQDWTTLRQELQGKAERMSWALSDWADNYAAVGRAVVPPEGMPTDRSAHTIAQYEHVRAHNIEAMMAYYHNVQATLEETKALEDTPKYLSALKGPCVKNSRTTV